jgi:hypothetical protein
MNTLTIYTVRDSKSDAYLQPFFLPNDAVAQRAITDCVNDPNHAFFNHPEDYTLFKLGEFNVQTGVITPLEPCNEALMNLAPLKLFETEETTNG